MSLRPLTSISQQATGFMASSELLSLTAKGVEVVDVELDKLFSPIAASEGVFGAADLWTQSEDLTRGDIKDISVDVVASFESE